MKKLIGVILALFLMIMPLMLCAQEHVPLTPTEVTQWMVTQSLDELVMFLIEADDWENSLPEIYMPMIAAILDDEGTLTIIYKGPLGVSIGTVRPLQYVWTLDNMVMENFYVEKKRAKWAWFAVGGGGILAGIVIHSLLH